jgi:DNA-binding LytR/AlgR family response regulator
MLSILRQPFPAQKNTWHTVRMCIIAGCCVFAVFYSIDPFDFASGSRIMPAMAGLAYGLVTLVLSLACTSLLPILAPRLFAEKGWTVVREIIFLLGMVLVIALGNVWLTMYVFNEKITWTLVLKITQYTVLIATVPVMLAVLVKQQRLLLKFSREAAVMDKLVTTAAPTILLPGHTAPRDIEHLPLQVGGELTTSVQTATAAGESLMTNTPAAEKNKALPLVFKGNNQSEILTLADYDFLFAEAADNYTALHYLQHGVIKQVLFRVAVKNLEEQAIAMPVIFRCHKSYLVNLLQVAHISGNAQGYKLHLQTGDFIVPVSRSLNTVISAKLQALHQKKA